MTKDPTEADGIHDPVREQGQKAREQRERMRQEREKIEQQEEGSHANGVETTS